MERQFTGKLRFIKVCGHNILQQEIIEYDVNDFTGEQTHKIYWSDVPLIESSTHAQ
jgi:hypothetical protein